jgi:CheY-like chemotaxis protein
MMSDDSLIRATPPEAKLILVVDDEFDLLWTYTMLLQHHGFRVQTASNGRDALSAAMRERPDIVLADFMMPVMGGAELCQEWRAHPQLRDIPFILSSAGTPSEDAEIPFDAYFKKPVQLEVLLDEIRRLLKSRA